MFPSMLVPPGLIALTLGRVTAWLSLTSLLALPCFIAILLWRFKESSVVPTIGWILRHFSTHFLEHTAINMELCHELAVAIIKALAFS